MAQVSAPLLSLDASGSIAGAIVFSKWKGRNYVRSLVKPSNPRSGGQTGMRSMLKFLSQNWGPLSAANKATWETRADQTTISEFNAFVKYNLARFRNYLPASKEDPCGDTYVGDDITGETATAGERQITLDGTVGSAIGYNWGVAIFRSLSSSFTLTWDKVIAVIPCPISTAFSYVDSPLDPDTYYYNFKSFSEEGLWGPDETEVNATVT